MPFDSPDVKLGELLDDVQSGKTQLPDFQREWKWDSDRIASLLASVSLGYPVGVLMTLEVGGDGTRFKSRPIAGVDPATVASPEKLMLDGQQRTTSLFQALKAGRPVDTIDAKGKKLKRWYYVDMQKALDPLFDREEAIVAVPEDRVGDRRRYEVVERATACRVRQRREPRLHDRRDAVRTNHVRSVAIAAHELVLDVAAVAVRAQCRGVVDRDQVPGPVAPVAEVPLTFLQ